MGLGKTAAGAYQSLADGYYEWEFVAAGVRDAAGNPLAARPRRSTSSGGTPPGNSWPTPAAPGG